MLVGIGQYEYFHWIIWRGQFIIEGLVVFILAESGASIYSLYFQAQVDLLWYGPVLFRGLHKTGYFFVTLVKPTFCLLPFSGCLQAFFLIFNFQEFEYDSICCCRSYWGFSGFRRPMVWCLQLFFGKILTFVSFQHFFCLVLLFRGFSGSLPCLHISHEHLVEFLREESGSGFDHPCYCSSEDACALTLAYNWP